MLREITGLSWVICIYFLPLYTLAHRVSVTLFWTAFVQSKHNRDVCKHSTHTAYLSIGGHCGTSRNNPCKMQVMLKFCLQSENSHELCRTDTTATGRIPWTAIMCLRRLEIELWVAWYNPYSVTWSLSHKLNKAAGLMYNAMSMSTGTDKFNCNNCQLSIKCLRPVNIYNVASFDFFPPKFFCIYKLRLLMLIFPFVQKYHFLSLVLYLSVFYRAGGLQLWHHWDVLAQIIWQGNRVDVKGWKCILIFVSQSTR